MKDTLQTTPLPHELLGVEPGCSDRKTIRNAWVAAIQRREADHATLKLAHDILLDPVRRAECELLLYHREAFDNVHPSPFADPSTLDPKNRAETSRKWQTQLRKQGANTWLAHALAVLWYWGAVHEQQSTDEELKAIQLSGAVNGQLTSVRRRLEVLHDHWMHVIGYWGMVASSPQFWKSLEAAKGLPFSAVRERFIVQLQSTLRDLGNNGALEQTGDGRIIERFQSLEHVFATELVTAHEVGQLGLVKLGYAGPVLLKQLGILDIVYRELADKLERHPKSKALKNLRQLLSPYRAIETLIRDDPQGALDSIDALPDSERSSDEVACLCAKARNARAKELADLKKYDDALGMWRDARKHRRDKSTDQQIIAAVASTCLQAAVEFEGKQLDRAIDVLEKGLAIVSSDERLKAGLSDHLTRRGVERINKAQKEAGTSPDVVASKLPELVGVFDKAIADLDRAATLGSKDATRLASDAREALTNLRAGPYFTQGMDRINRALEKAQNEGGLTDAIKAEIQRGIRDLDKAAELGSGDARERAKEIRDLLKRAEEQVPGWARKANEAGKAAQAGNWDRAIDLLRQAITEGGREVPDNLKKNLAVCLTNRGIQRANRAVEELNGNSDGGLPDFVMEKLRKNRYSDDCAMCGKSKYSARGESWCEVTLTEGGTASLCSQCAGILQGVASSTSGPNATALISLQAAEKDLKEAVSLDSSNNQARQNLSELQSLLAKLPRRSSSGNRPARKPWKAPAWLGTAGPWIVLWLVDAVLGAMIAAIVGAALQASHPETYKTFGDAFGAVFGLYISTSFIAYSSGFVNTAFLIYFLLAMICRWLEWFNNISKPPRYY